MGYKVAVAGATGNVGREMLNILAERQFPADEVAVLASRKSLGTEDTFLSDIFDLETARAEVETLAAKVWRQASDRHLHARTVTLKVKYADFQQITRSRTLSVPLSSSAELEGLSIALLDPLFPTRKGIRLLGVTVSTLSAPDETEPAEARQLSLF